MTILEQIRAIRAAMDKAGLLLNQNQAANLVYLYKPWALSSHYKVGARCRYYDVVYECRQEHDALENYKPDLAPALWTRLDVNNSGSATDPIPYTAGMVVEKGKYYIENEIVYLCIRDSVNPIYHNLSDLIGQYVEVGFKEV